MRGAQQELPVAEGKEIQRNDGERIGIERDQQRHGDVLAQRDRHQQRAEHLQRSGNEAAEKADRHRARHRPSIEAPQVRVMQPAGERRHQPACAHGVDVGQVLLEELAGHG